MGRTDATPARIARECLAVRLRLLNRVVTRIYDDALRPYGVTTAQVNVLVVVALRGPVAAADVARRLELEKSTLSRNLVRLEERGLVARQGGRLLRITRKGRRLLERAEPAWEEAQAAAARVLGTKGARVLKEVASAAGL